MKKLILVFMATLILSPCFVMARDLTFSWDPNQEEALSGYRIHYGSETKAYTTIVDAKLPAIVDGDVVYTVVGAPDDTTYFAATAYDSTGQESDYSDEVMVPKVAVGAPQELEFNAPVIINIKVN